MREFSQLQRGSPMKVRRMLAVLVGVLVAVSFAQGQTPATTAKVETAALELMTPERFQIPAVLEPIRHVTILSPGDGVIRSIEVPVGATVREGQEIAQLDRVE